MNLKGKTVLIGVSGSIAAYKIASLVSSLKKLDANVHVVMTSNATNFINPITFETLSNNKCLVDTFDRNFEFKTEHISISKQADLVVLAPATANVIGKIANGIADDMLTTTVMATKAPVVIAPAMNTNMYQNPIVAENIKKLEGLGYLFVPPRVSRLACGTVGVGAMAAEENIIEKAVDALTKKDMTGMHVLVTAGPTTEAIDPVRFITNHSSGKMGVSIAIDAKRRGAKVTLISGPISVLLPSGIKHIKVTSAQEMYDAVFAGYEEADIIIKAAAVADFRPESMCENKIKKENATLQLSLVKNPDILKELGKVKGDRVLIGFCMETQDLIENAQKKLASKNADMIVANNLCDAGAGFGVDTNTVTFVTKNDITPLPNMTKADVAKEILNKAIRFKAEGAQC